jgi:hypothetical protein
VSLHRLTLASTDMGPTCTFLRYFIQVHEDGNGGNNISSRRFKFLSKAETVYRIKNKHNLYPRIYPLNLTFDDNYLE